MTEESAAEPVPEAENAAEAAAEAAPKEKKNPLEGWGDGIKHAFTPKHKDHKDDEGKERKNLFEAMGITRKKGDDNKKREKFMGIPLKASTDTTNEDANELHQLILKEKWDNVSEFLDKEEALTQVTQWCRKDLPIHMALDAKGGVAPDVVIKKLMELFPDSAKERGKNKRLPLQLARKHKCPRPAVYESIIAAWPEALDEPLQPPDAKFESAFDKNTVRSKDAGGLWHKMPLDVKRLLQRSTRDWIIFLEFEADQREMGEGIQTLETDLRAAKKCIKACKAAEAKLEGRIAAIEEAFATKKEENDKRINNLRTQIESFETDQTATNEELEKGIEEAQTRRAEDKNEFRALSSELLAAYEKSLKNDENLAKDVGDAVGKASTARGAERGNEKEEASLPPMASESVEVVG